MVVKIEELYKKLQKEFSLPKYEDMDKEFEISSLEDEQFFLRHIIENIDEKISDVTKIFEGLLHPEGSFSGYREANSFTDEEREKMLDAYKKFMFFHRRATELSIDDSDKSNAEFINDLMKEWPGMKKEALSFVKRLKDSWTKEITKKEVVRYLG